METASDHDFYITTAELMAKLSVSRSSVNRWVQRGVPHIWIGSQRRYPYVQVVQWLKQTHG